MKTSKLILGTAALMALTLSSCQKEKLMYKDSVSTDEKVGIEIVAEYAPQTKTYLDEDGKVHWSENESLAVFEVANFATLSPVTSYAASANGTIVDNSDRYMKFSVEFPTQKYANKLNYYAVYPNNAVPANIKTSKNIDVSNVTVTLNEIQKPTATSFAPDADILAASLTIIPDTSAEEEEDGLSFSFARLVAIGKMKIENITIPDPDNNDMKLLEDAPIYRIEIKANSNISGNTVFNLKNRVAKDGKYGNKKTIILDYSYDDSADDAKPIIKTPFKGAKTAVYFTTWPFTVAKGESFEVSIETPDHIITKNIKIPDTGNDLVFNKGNIRSFTVDFSNGAFTVIEKPGSLLNEKSTYVIKNGDALMSSIVYTNGTLTPKEEFTTANDKVVIDEELLSAAWGFEYHKMSRTYKIHSLSNPDKYLVVGASTVNSLTLSTKEAATDFIISKSDGTYIVSGKNMYLGYLNNAGGKRFLMIQNNNASTALEIIEATVQPAIKVNSTTVDVPGDFTGEQTIPVSYFAIENTDNVAVMFSDEDGTKPQNEYAWIKDVKLNGDKSAVTFNINSSNTQTDRTAYIKIYTEKASKILKVVQHTTYYCASLDITENSLIQAKKDGLWGGFGKVYTYVQPNGAAWKIDANTDGAVSFYSLNTLNNGSIKLPVFGKNITAVTIKLKDPITANKELQLCDTLDKKIIVANKTTNNTDLVYRLIVPASTKEETVKTGVIKSTGYAKIVRIDADTRTVLTTPQNITTEDATGNTTMTLSWDKVPNAAAYEVTVGTTTENVTTNSYEFKGVAEYYDVTVIAMPEENSNDYINSEAASKKNVKFGEPKLQAPVITVEGMTATTLKVKWAAVEKASSYECTIDGGELATVTDLENGYYGAQFSGLTGGESYTVKVTAKHADENVYKASSASIEVTLPDVELDGDGSEQTSYTVKDINTLHDNGLLNLAGKYVEGKVIGDPVFNRDDKTMTYTITDDTTNEDGTPKTWPVTGKDLGNAGFSSVNDLPVGSEVKIYYTDNDNNYLYSINGKTAIVIGITVTPTKTAFYTGDKFVDPVVTGIFRGTPENSDVTKSCKIEGYDMSKVGTQFVTVTYSDDIKATYEITVNASDSKVYTQVFNSSTAALQTGTKKFTNTCDDFTITLTNIRNGNATGYFANWVRCINTTGTASITGTITTQPISTKIRTVKVTVKANTAGGVENGLVIKDANGNEVGTVDGTTIGNVAANSSSNPYEVTYSIPANVAGNNYIYELQFTNNGAKNQYIDISKIVYTPEVK